MVCIRCEIFCSFFYRVIIVGRKCTLVFNSYDFHVCGRSSVGECTCVCEVYFGGVPDLHVYELLVYFILQLSR